MKKQTPCRKALLGKANSASASQELPNIMETGGSSQCSQEPATCPYAEPYQSNPALLSHCLTIHFYTSISIRHIRKGHPSCHVSSGVATSILIVMYVPFCIFCLCCSVYCLCVNVYCTAATGCQPNCS